MERVALSGGDGSLHCLLSALLAHAPPERWPAVALLRTGTMNTLASNLGLRGRPTDLAAAVATAEPVPVPFLQVGAHAGFLFGVGVHVAFLEEYYRGRTGPLGAGLLLGRVAAGLVTGSAMARGMLRTTPAIVELDGARWPERDWHGIGAGTLPSVGLGFRPCPDTPTAGRLQAYGFGGSPFTILGNLPRIRLAKPLRGHGVQQALGRALTVTGEEPVGYMLDGDLHRGDTSITVEVGGEVRLLQPTGLVRAAL